MEDEFDISEPCASCGRDTCFGCIYSGRVNCDSHETPQTRRWKQDPDSDCYGCDRRDCSHCMNGGKIDWGDNDSDWDDD